MKRSPFFLLAFASLAAARPLPTVRSTDFHPNPAFVPLRLSSVAEDAPAASVEQYGEVVIVEGDETLVSGDASGGYGIVFNQTVQQPPLITQRFYTKYGDDFDEIVVFTTFDDSGAAGALAYEISAQQDIQGIGQQMFDESGDGGWGALDHHLHAFVNMMRWDQYHDMDGLDITDPSSGLYSTLGQEFAHRWLSFLRYRDKNGLVSDAMLGRDKAHWASTLQADASVMDGDRIVDNLDGTFTDVETFARYSPLDQYAMGLVGPESVPPWFLVKNAVTMTGKVIDPAQYMRVGNRFRGDREDIAIADVIKAEGARSPSWQQAPHAFRVAFVLLTRPGEKAAEVLDAARKLDVARKVWEQKFGDYTAGHGTMCTQVSAPCGAPTAKLAGGTFAEAGGNGNGVIEPGEPVRVTFTLANDSPASADAVSVVASSDVLQFDGKPQTVSAIAPGQSADVAFIGMLPKDAPCGQSMLVRAASTVGGNTFRGFAQVTPGLADVIHDDFERDRGLFGANLDGADTAANGFQWGTPVGYNGRRGWTFQPGSCHASERCWFTGLGAGHRPAAQGDTSQSALVGKSVLWSPVMDLAHTFQPALRYFAWYQSIDFSNPQQGGGTVDDVPLVVEGSTDGGKTWIPLDQVTGAETVWQERRVDLAAAKVPLDGALVVRFTVSNDDPRVLVEAGIDDVELVTQTTACNPNAVGEPTMPSATAPVAGCSIGNGRASFVSLALLIAVAALLLLRRRSR